MEKIILNRKRKVSLTPYIVNHDFQPCFLICPGGSYRTCDPRESEPVARKFNEKGFNCFVLQYSVAQHATWPNPLEDFERAMTCLKEHKEEFGINEERIIAAGFSAGGHLVACAASIAKQKPFACIICYGPTTKETLKEVAPSMPDANELVNANTCPCFLAYSRNDWIVPIDNLNRFVEKLNAFTIDYEQHVYGYSFHGFSIGRECGAVKPNWCNHVGDWVDEAVEWVTDLSSGEYISIRNSAAYQDANSSTYTIHNSIGVLFENNALKKLLKKHFLKEVMIAEAAGIGNGELISHYSFDNVLLFMRVKEERRNEIDNFLKQIRREKHV